MDRNELPFDPHHLGVPLGMPKTNSMPMVYLAQAMHFSNAEINTVSKRIEATFHLTNVT
jgi:hypothetical protein